MTSHTVTVRFDVECESPTHGVFKVEKWLKEKGVGKAGTEELTLGRTEERFGWSEIEVEDNK